jgi:uncharacterized protein YgbK (DUF1537 family)
VLLCLGSPHPVTQAQQVRLLAERPVTTLDASSYESINHVVGAAGPLLLPITSATPEDLSATLAIVTAGELAGVVLSGGDTATDVCAALGADAIEPGGEVASGMPWGILHGGRASGLPVVLKAGSFGADDALVRAVDFLSMNDGPDAER